MKKQRKLQPKIERLCKALGWDYKKDIFKWSITLRESNIINCNKICDFKIKYNVEVRIGIGCLVIEDNLSKYKYLVSYTKNKLNIDCRLK